MPTITHDTKLETKFGDRIREKRQELGLSIREFAEIAGVSGQQLNKYEKGSNRISASMLYKIAHGLGTPISYFYSGLNGDSDEQLPIEMLFFAAPGAYELAQAFVKMSEPMQKLALQLMISTQQQAEAMAPAAKKRGR